MTLNTLLQQIKCKRTYIGKSSMTSGNAYRVTLTYKGKQWRFVFNDNYLNKSRKRDFLQSVYFDALAFQSSQTLPQFKRDYGYENWAEANKAYNACKRACKRLYTLFNDDEINLIASIY